MKEEQVEEDDKNENSISTDTKNSDPEKVMDEDDLIINSNDTLNKAKKSLKKKNKYNLVEPNDLIISCKKMILCQKCKFIQNLWSSR